MAAIYLVSSLPALPEPLAVQSLWGEVVRYGGHAVEFAVLAVLSCRALAGVLGARWGRLGGGEWRRVAWAAAGFSVAYALFDELRQLFVPGRTCSLVDLAIDSAGAFAVVGLINRSGAIRRLLTLSLRHFSRLTFDA